MPSIFPAFDDESFLHVDFDGRSLSDNLELLDETARSLNLPPLSSYIDAATMAQDYGPEDIDIDSLPPVQWYTADDGIVTVSGLRAHIESNANDFAADRNGVLTDLEQLEVLLAEAGENDVLFHLLVDV